MNKEQILNSIPNWWKELVRMWIEEIELERLNVDEVISYVKEKYWMICFEWRSNDIIRWIEAASAYICQECWNVWRIRYELPWYKCLCNKCLEETKKTH